jgi:hypothetical protein
MPVTAPGEAREEVRHLFLDVGPRAHMTEPKLCLEMREGGGGLQRARRSPQPFRKRSSSAPSSYRSFID